MGGCGRTVRRFDPRRAAKDHEGPRRTPLTPLIHEGPRRATKDHEEGQGQLQNCEEQKVNVNCNFFFPRWGAKGREGPRRTPLTPLIHEGPRRATKDHEEGQGQLQNCEEQKVNVNCNFFFPRWGAKGREGPRRTPLTPLIHEGPRRATKGHEEGQGQLQNCEEQKVNVNCNFFLPRWGAKGREEHL